MHFCTDNILISSCFVFYYYTVYGALSDEVSKAECYDLSLDARVVEVVEVVCELLFASLLALDLILILVLICGDSFSFETS